MSAANTIVEVLNSLSTRFNLNHLNRQLSALSKFQPSDADVFLAHQIRALALAIEELNMRLGDPNGD